MSRLHEEKMRDLVRDISRGRYREGEWLPREVDLAAELDISRGAARETIRALEERRVVSVRHGRGARVRPIAEWNLLDGDVLAALVERRETHDVIAEALECRRLLEGEAAMLAAQRADAAGARELTEAFEALRSAVERDGDVAGAAARFRETLVRMSGNRPLGRMLSPLDAVDAFALSALRGKAAKALVERYERVLTAVCAGDADGARTAVEDDVAAVAKLVAAPSPRR